MTGYLAPGIYTQVVDASGPVITGVRTDIAGFAGIAERGPVDLPVPLESWRQFEAHFGSFIPGGYLAYSVRAFFENGGRRCWVVRVASRDPGKGFQSASLSVPPAPGSWRIIASSPGTWGNGLKVRLVETNLAETSGSSTGDLPDFTTVADTGGFARATLVRLAQPGLPPRYRVVSSVDAERRRIYWVNPAPERRLRYDQPVSGLIGSLPLVLQSVEYTLAVHLHGRPIALYPALSIIPEHNRYGKSLLRPTSAPGDVAAERGVPAPPPPLIIEELRPAFQSGRRDSLGLGPHHILSPVEGKLTGGRDGLTLLTAGDFTGEEWSPADSDTVRAERDRGIRRLAAISEIAMIAVPDIHIEAEEPPALAPPKRCDPDPCLPTPPPSPAQPVRETAELPPRFAESDIYRVQATLISLCEQAGDRVALLDPPAGTALGSHAGLAAVQAWRARFDTTYAALFYPWLRVLNPLRGVRTLTRDIPPSGHVAGQIARTDIETGVHKAAANAALEWSQGLTLEVDERQQEGLNPLGINVIRLFGQRGTRIYGARTLSSNPSWRFLPIRRLVLMVRKAIDLATQWVPFEPNDAGTRAKLAVALAEYLTTLWQRGMLAGNSIDDSFAVKCDEENNPPDERASGRLRADVAIAPATPFEFIVLRVSRTASELEITESAVRAGGR